MNNLPINHPLLQLARQFADTLFSPLGGLLAAAAAVFLFGCAYTVDQAEQVVITQFGRPVGQPINAAEARRAALQAAVCADSQSV